MHFHTRKWMSSGKWWPSCLGLNVLTHWGRVTHICVSNLTTIGSVNGLSPGRRQAITWTNAGILLIGPLGTNFSEILIEIPTFLLKKMHLKVSSAKWRPSCLGLKVLTQHPTLLESGARDNNFQFDYCDTLVKKTHQYLINAVTRLNKIIIRLDC